MEYEDEDHDEFEKTMNEIEEGLEKKGYIKFSPAKHIPNIRTEKMNQDINTVKYNSFGACPHCGCRWYYQLIGGKGVKCAECNRNYECHNFKK